jgi:hypothetical protein
LQHGVVAFMLHVNFDPGLAESDAKSVVKEQNKPLGQNSTHATK